MNTAYNPEVAADKARDPKGNGQSEALTLDTAFPETARVFAEKTVAQTREVYDRSKDALEAAVDTMEKSFDAAGQGAVALNRKIIDIAQRNLDLAGGHKMTDDEIREALRLDFEQTADWRRSKAAEYPEDSRNLEAAALLDKLAASVETVAPDLLDAYGSLRDDYMDSEQHSEMFRQIGFHSWPETAEDFVKACIADRAMGA